MGLEHASVMKPRLAEKQEFEVTFYKSSAARRRPGRGRPLEGQFTGRDLGA
jgi:hypothetical protein